MFTDIEGSTALLERLGSRYADVLYEHRRIVREVVARHGGREVDHQGDGFFLAFPGAGGAVAAARELQASLGGLPVRVRIGVHTGEPDVAAEGYVGLDVHRAARICAAAHGGQVIVSEATAMLLGDRSQLMDLGPVRLKDLSARQRLYQLGEEAFPPPRALRQTNLPIVTSSLVGRRAELAELIERVRRDRVVTLIGAGGSGKTRLALQVAAEVAEAFDDGVWWVPLAAVSNVELIHDAVASALGSGPDLAAFLAARSVLIVVDNAEHLRQAGARLAEIARAGSGVHLLVTSREPLHITGEQRYPVSPLTEDDAIDLFLERARAVDPTEVRRDHAKAVCDRLDRLPLAIELAAARVSVFSPDQLIGRLEHALSVLTAGPQDAPVRHQTLRSTIDWSYQLLSGDDAQAFGRLSVFRGGFQLDAAEQVTSVSVESLTSLVEKSLVRRVASARFGMLELVRQFARELLSDTQEEQAMRDRHLDYFLGYAEAAPVPFRDSGSSAEHLTPELGNLRAALEHAATHSPRQHVRLGAALTRYWLTEEMYADSRAWIAAAQLDPPDLSDRESAGALLAASTVAYFSVQDARLAIRYADQGLRFARQAGDPTLEARLLLAASSPRADDHWIERLEQAVHIGNELDDPPLRRLTLHRLGEARRDHGCLDAARTLLEESLQISRRLADGFGANTEHSLGDLELDAGNYAEALRRYAAAMIEWPPTRRTQIYCVAGIAAALAASGSPDPAITLWNRAEQEEQRSGARMLDIERPRYETHVTHAARTVSPETTSHAQHQASAMSWDDALETALSYVA